MNPSVAGASSNDTEYNHASGCVLAQVRQMVAGTPGARSAVQITREAVFRKDGKRRDTEISYTITNLPRERTDAKTLFALSCSHCGAVENGSSNLCQIAETVTIRHNPPIDSEHWIYLKHRPVTRSQASIDGNESCRVATFAHRLAGAKNRYLLGASLTLRQAAVNFPNDWRSRPHPGGGVGSDPAEDAISHVEADSSQLLRNPWPR